MDKQKRTPLSLCEQDPRSPKHQKAANLIISAIKKTVTVLLSQPFKTEHLKSYHLHQLEKKMFMYKCNVLVGKLYEH